MTYEEWINYWEDEQDSIITAADMWPTVRTVGIDYLALPEELRDWLEMDALAAMNAAEQALNDSIPYAYLQPGMHLVPMIERMPASETVTVHDIRREHLGRLIAVHGLAVKVSEVRARLRTGVWECQACTGRTEKEYGMDDQLDPPGRCPDCGKPLGKTAFRLIESGCEYRDNQRLDLQEHIEYSSRAQPARITAIMEGPLTGTVQPGDRVILYASPRVRQIGKKNLFSIYLHVHGLQVEGGDDDGDSMTEDDLAQLKAMVQDVAGGDYMAAARASFAPDIIGHDRVKEAIILSMVGAPGRESPERKARGTIHTLLVGDPATAKSRLLRAVARLMPRSQYAYGTGSTRAGLTAAVTRDEEDGRWVIEAGAIVLASGSVACVDELEKLRTEDLSGLLEAMEDGTVTIQKAAKATMTADTTIIAAANPRLGRWDTYTTIAEQIRIPASLVSRFDTIWPILDEPHEARDEAIASHILAVHAGEVAPAIPHPLMRKWLTHARTITPTMTDAARRAIQEYYVRKRASSDRRSVITITPRQLEGMIRMSEARARLRLSRTVTVTDAKATIELMEAYLRQFAEGGAPAIDLVETNLAPSRREVAALIIQALREYAAEDRRGALPEDVIRALPENIPDHVVEEELRKLARQGIIYEPVRGRWRVI